MSSTRDLYMWLSRGKKDDASDSDWEKLMHNNNENNEVNDIQRRWEDIEIQLELEKWKIEN